MIPMFAVAPLLAVLALVAWRLKWLSLGGAIAGAALGILIWAGGEWAAFLPLLYFFLSGTLLSKLPTKVLADRKQQNPRDAVQVLCNGGVAGLLMAGQLWQDHQVWLWLLYGSLAASTADTWSSSIGQWQGGRVVNLATLRKTTPGISGGISFWGTMAGLAGAVSVGAMMMFITVASFKLAGLIALAGFAGMAADSLIGSLWQAKYRLQNGILADFIPNFQNGQLERGSPVITNDLVNLLSNLLIVLILALFFWFLP